MSQMVMEWQLRGSFAELEIELLDDMGKVIAILGRKMILVKEMYCVDGKKIYHWKCFGKLQTSIYGCLWIILARGSLSNLP